VRKFKWYWRRPGSPTRSARQTTSPTKFFKRIITGERQSIQRKNCSNIDMALGIPVFLTANHLPSINDHGESVYNRLLIIPDDQRQAGGHDEQQRSYDKARHRASRVSGGAGRPAIVDLLLSMQWPSLRLG
jgi:hypothetical protein